jgi:MYXO-CTERM domain-containing protein
LRAVFGARTLAAAWPLLIAQPALAGVMCTDVQIVEIFAGTDECPDAQYVMMRMVVDLQGAVGGTHVDTGSGVFGTFPPGDAPNALMGDALLVATARAEGLFGIDADAVAWGDVLLDLPQGTVSYSCSGETVLYGDVGPDLTRGMALKRVGANWVLGAPAPFNNAGDLGVLGTCPPDPDAGAGAEPPRDASVGDEPILDDSGGEGCGCRVGASPERRAWPALLLLGALMARRQP